MITVGEIRRKSASIYSELLKDYIKDATSFPKVIRSDKSLSRDFPEMSQEIAQIMAESKDRKGFGYLVKSEPVKTRLHGIQNIPKAIVFDTLVDLLKFIGKTKEYEIFVEQSKFVLGEYPQLKEYLSKKPELIVTNFGKWDDLIKVCNWFYYHYESDRYYIRELPISVHSKFIEENKSTIQTLLDVLISEKTIRDETNFEKRFRLRYAEPTIRFRLLDPNLLKGSGYSDISVPLSQFANHIIDCRTIIVVENLMNFLTFPQVEKGIAIWGKGFAVDSLKLINWFADKKILYWSDLDVQGFQMLSQIRSYYQNVQSFLMSMETLNSYKEFWVKGTPSNIEDLPFLDDDERIVFHFLKEHNIRLEQERISQHRVIENI